MTLNAGRYYYSELLKSGVKLYRRRDVMLHAKTAVIDNVWSTVGSTNMDFWSFSTNDEVNAVILSKEFAAEMEKMFARDLAESDEIRLEEWKKRPVLDKIKQWIAHRFRTLVVIDRRRMSKKPPYRRLSGIVPLVVFAAILCGEGSSRADAVTAASLRKRNLSSLSRPGEFTCRKGLGPRRIGSRLDAAGLHRLDGSGLHDIGGGGGAFPPCLRSRGSSPAYRGDLRAYRHTVLVDHSQAMADADHRRPRFVGCDRRSTSGRLLPRRDGGRQESILSTGG